MDSFQVTRTYWNRRTHYAWWDAKQINMNLWCVHFHADNVVSTDWTAGNEGDLQMHIGAEMREWIIAINKKEAFRRITE